MTRELIYYVEINITCICVMAVLLLSDLRKRNDHEPRLFLCLTVSNIFFCLSDIAAIALRGSNYAYSNIVLWAANIIYVVSMCMLSYFWFVYSFAVINRKYLARKFILLTLIPALLSIVLTLASIKTGWIFTINEANLYSRGPLIWIQWAQQWIYLIAPSIIAIFKNINKRNNDLMSVAFFMIPPFIAGAVQMLYYGISALQVGATISILVVYLRLQNKQIFMDSLTEVFNRGSLNKNLERLFASQDQYFYMLMLDLNDFKEINDVYGHLKGDLYLTEFATILNNIAATCKEKASVFRYGGDEFVVLGLDADPNSAADFTRSIYASVNEFNRKKILPRKISVSVGATHGLVSSYANIDEILTAVDKDMYNQKIEHKKRQNIIAALSATVNSNSDSSVVQ